MPRYNYYRTRFERTVDWCLETTGLGFDVLCDAWESRWCGYIAAPILMLVVAPIGLIARLFGKDPYR